MNNSDTHADKMARTNLKQNTLRYMPRNLSDVEAQRQILQMISEAIPSVASCADYADAQVWPKVTNQGLPMGQAIAQCAYQTDKLIAANFQESLELENLPEQTLLKAWIALDYYAYVLKEDYSANIRNTQDCIADILLGEKKNPQTEMHYMNPPVRIPDECGPTQPVVIPEEPPASAKPEHKAASVKPRKSIIKIAAPVAAVLVIALIAAFFFSKPQQAKRAINAIGTVTLDSGETIESAEQYLDELTEAQKNKVANADVLVEARAEYDRLVVQDTIDKIGKVTMESGKSIEDAEKLYEALPRAKRNQVENYQTLAEARNEFTRLVTAVQRASDAIDAIGTVTTDSGSEIAEARDAYDALKKDDLEFYLSDKAKLLTDAEAAYAQCCSEELYNSGVSLYEEGNFEEALEKFHTIISDYSATAMLEHAKNGVADCQLALAQNAYKGNDYYTTMKMLSAVEEAYQSGEAYQKLRESVLTKLKNGRPVNGKVIGGELTWGYCYFKVTAGDQDICLKVTNAEDTSKYKMIYIRAGESGQIKVKDGVYSVEWASGEHWYNKDHMFGDETVYRKRAGNTTFSTRYEGNWVYYYYLQLDADDLKNGLTISADEF